MTNDEVIRVGVGFCDSGYTRVERKCPGTCAARAVWVGETGAAPCVRRCTTGFSLHQLSLELCVCQEATGRCDGWSVRVSSSLFWRQWGAFIRKERPGIRGQLRLWVCEIRVQRVELIHHGSAENNPRSAVQIMDNDRVCNPGCSSSRLDYWIISLSQYVNGSGNLHPFNPDSMLALPSGTLRHDNKAEMYLHQGLHANKLS